MTFASSRLPAVLCLCAFLSACAGANWQTVQVSPTYQPPKEVQVAVVSKSQAIQNDEAVKVLTETLAKDLAGHGIKASFVAAPSGPSGNLDVVEWNRGVRALRWLGFGGQGHLVVVVNTPSADGQSGVNGTARGWVKGGFFGGSSFQSAVEAGHLISKAIATGKTN